MSYTEESRSQVDLAHNHINVQVFQLLEDLEAAGNTSTPRGLKTREANLAELEIDPYWCAIDFPGRRFNWKYFAGELAWYLRAEPEIDFITNFSSFWKGVCPDGKANSNYGNLLLKIHPDTLMDEAEYGGGVNQLEWAFNSLVKDQNTRQAVMFFNSPHFQYEGNRDFVCTMYVNFWIRKGYLDMKVQMRSNDIFFGLTFDAPWFSTLMQSMYLNLKGIYPDLKLGRYYHCADNIHYYERHFELAEKILDSQLDSAIELRLKHPLFRFRKDKKNDRYVLAPSQEADAFRKAVEQTVDSGRIGHLSDNEWKNILSDLYELRGDTDVNLDNE